jgi:hypothetical protein
MEQKFIKKNQKSGLDFSPDIWRLVPLKQYQSPWKFLPNIGKKSESIFRECEVRSIDNGRKHKIRLKLPKIIVDDDYIGLPNISMKKKSMILSKKKSNYRNISKIFAGSLNI